AHVDHVGLRDAAPLAIVLADLDAVRLGVVDDDGQLAGFQVAGGDELGAGGAGQAEGDEGEQANEATQGSGHCNPLSNRVAPSCLSLTYRSGPEPNTGPRLMSLKVWRRPWLGST